MKAHFLQCRVSSNTSVHVLQTSTYNLNFIVLSLCVSCSTQTTAAFVAHTEQEIQEMCNSFATAEFGLTISLSKTVVMAQNVNGTVLSVVEKCVYLGSTLKANNSLDAELNTRIGRTSTTFGRLQSCVWNNSHLSLKVKVRVNKTCVLSVLLYGSET